MHVCEVDQIEKSNTIHEIRETNKTDEINKTDGIDEINKLDESNEIEFYISADRVQPQICTGMWYRELWHRHAKARVA